MLRPERKTPTNGARRVPRHEEQTNPFYYVTKGPWLVAPEGPKDAWGTEQYLHEVTRILFELDVQTDIALQSAYTKLADIKAARNRSPAQQFGALHDLCQDILTTVEGSVNGIPAKADGVGELLKGFASLSVELDELREEHAGLDEEQEEEMAQLEAANAVDVTGLDEDIAELRNRLARWERQHFKHKELIMLCEAVCTFKLLAQKHVYQGSATGHYHILSINELESISKEATSGLTSDQQGRWEEVKEFIVQCGCLSIPEILHVDKCLRGKRYESAHGFESELQSTTTNSLKQWAQLHLVSRPDLMTPAQSFIDMLALFTTGDTPLQPSKTFEMVRQEVQSQHVNNINSSQK